jgi:hypothetical protein
LWKHRQVYAALGIYAAAVFRLVASRAGHTFGQDLVDETWELAL